MVLPEFRVTVKIARLCCVVPPTKQNLKLSLFWILVYLQPLVASRLATFKSLVSFSLSFHHSAQNISDYYLSSFVKSFLICCLFVFYNCWRHYFLALLPFFYLYFLMVFIRSHLKLFMLFVKILDLLVSPSESSSPIHWLGWWVNLTRHIAIHFIIIFDFIIFFNLKSDKFKQS